MLDDADSFDTDNKNYELRATDNDLLLIVEALNTSPTAVDDSFNIDEDSSITITAKQLLDNDTDTDGDPLIIEGIDTNGKDIIGLSGGISFKDLIFKGSDIFFGEETLATLTGIDATSLGESDFTTV